MTIKGSQVNRLNRSRCANRDNQVSSKLNQLYQVYYVQTNEQKNYLFGAVVTNYSSETTRKRITIITTTEEQLDLKALEAEVMHRNNDTN